MDKEVRQILTMDAIEPGNSKNLINKYRCNSLGNIILFKKKCDGIIKARGFCDSHKQRDYMTK